MHRNATVTLLIAYIYRSHAAKLRDALTRLLQHPDEEAVHDVRVTCRRLRTAIEIGKRMFRKRVIKAARERVKELLKLLGEIRDAEVLSARARELSVAKSQADLLELSKLFEAQMCLHRLKAVAAVERGNFWSLPRLIEALVETPAHDPKGIAKLQKKTVGEMAADVLGDHFKDIQSYRKLNANSKSEDLHQLRIEFKRFRYAAEFFAPAVPTTAIAKAGEQFQEVLGELHDADVADEMLSPWMRRPAVVTQPLPELAPPSAEATVAEPASSEKTGDDRHLSDAIGTLVVAARAEQISLRERFGKLWTEKGLAQIRSKIDALSRPLLKRKPTAAVRRK